MDLHSLHAFIEVARLESFSKASETLFLTQSAISKRIAFLEDELGAKLFNRINRQVSLTNAGRNLLPKAQELINQAADMKRYATNLSNEVAGPLSVATSHHIGLRRLPPILKEFNKTYKDVDLAIQFGESDQACDQVVRGEMELAIVTLPNTLPAELEGKTIWHDKLHVVVGHEHTLANSSKTELTELINYSCVFPSDDTETHKIMQRAAGSLESDLKVQMTTNNLETIKMLVEAGFGWSLLPETMLDEGLFVLDIGLELSRNLGLVWHKKRSLSNAANAMQQLINGHAYDGNE